MNQADSQIPSDYLGPMREKDGFVTLIATEINGRPANLYAEKEVRIVGTQFRNEEDLKPRQAICQNLVRMLKLFPTKQVVLTLHREPTNQHDSNAIGIYLEGPDKPEAPTGRVGYVPKELAAEIAETIDDGSFKPFAKVASYKKNGMGLWVISVNLFEYTDGKA